jgi:phenylalanine-4-hydroxylase
MKTVADPLNRDKTSLMFTLPDNPGALCRALQFFEQHGVSLTRIESRPAKHSSDYEFYVDFKGSESEKPTLSLLKDLRGSCRQVNVLHSLEVPWFPRKLKEVDKLAEQILDAGAELQADHPGFHDVKYRARRKELAQVAVNYRMGQPIQRITYTPEEISAWKAVFERIMPLLERHACAEYIRLFPLLEENCGYRADNIPQLQDVSEFLKECTGFTIRPVAGLLSARNFLYGLAFRIFFSTQYIRHHAKPLYTPEPDICHEVLGHAPLFADQNFADFSQEIGLAALGASDEQIVKLARCYWYSVEFGLCLQNGERKAYGAGLLSSYGELEYAMGSEPKILPWDPVDAGARDYPITTYQPVYYQAESFEDAKAKMKKLTDSFVRCFNVRYNPYSQSIEVDRNLKVSLPS